MSEYLDKDGLVLYNEKVKEALNKKQDVLIPGEGITIGADGKTISASGGSSCESIPIEFIESLCLPMELVDLGLPSGTLWAKYNLGSEDEYDYGLLFQYLDQYGMDYTEAVFNNQGIWDNAPFNSGSSSYDSDAFEQIKDDLCPDNVIDLGYDPAFYKLDDHYRMPTKEDIDELIANTTVSSYDGFGAKLTSKINPDKYIVIPFFGKVVEGNIVDNFTAGYILSSSLKSDDYSSCWHLRVDETTASVSSAIRPTIMNIRPVYKK